MRPPRIVILPWTPHFAGFSLWNLILVNLRYAGNARLIAHELVHYDQWRQYGLTFPFRYVWAWIRAGFSYTRNPFEVEARQLEGTLRYRRRAKRVMPS